MRRIPLVDVAARHRIYRNVFAKILRDIMSTALFIRGPAVSSFEQAFARQQKTRYAVGVSSGTDALVIALESLGIGPGDEVIIPAFTFVSTAFAVLVVGAKPVLVDVDPVTLSIDPEACRKTITKKTKAIIPVHLYGMPADMDRIRAITRHTQIAIIEDAAQAQGALYKGKPAGSLGTIGCFSFYPSKNLGALGDGGAIVTDNPVLAKRCRLRSDLGTEKKYLHTVIAGNRRLDALQAAFLLAQLPALPHWNETRRGVARTYIRLLQGVPVTLPVNMPDRTQNHHLFVIRTRKQKALRRFLSLRGIETGIHYPIPLHLQPALSALGYPKGSFPVSESAALSVVSIPMYPELSQTQIRRIARAIRQFFSL